MNSVLTYVLESYFQGEKIEALVFFSGVILMIDGFAERRAKVYAEALRDRYIFSQNP